MSKSRTAPKKDTSNPHIAFTKAIDTITKSEESFKKSVAELQGLLSETFTDLEMKLKAKSDELKELEQRYLQQEKNSKIEVDLNVKEHGYQAALIILEQRDEMAVLKTVYKDLNTSYEGLKNDKHQIRNNKPSIIR